MQYAIIKPFAVDSSNHSVKNIEASFEAMSKALQNSGEKGKFQIKLLTKKQPTYIGFDLTPKNCEVNFKQSEKPDLELIAKEDTVWEMLHGKLSPLHAFRSGKLRIRGDASMGLRILKELASSHDAQFQICETGV